jgi:hypothetical protein
VTSERTRRESASIQEGVDTAANGDTLAVGGMCVGSAIIGADSTLKGGRDSTTDGDGIECERVSTLYDSVAVTDLTITGGALGGVTRFGTLALARSTVSGDTIVQGVAGPSTAAPSCSTIRPLRATPAIRRRGSPEHRHPVLGRDCDVRSLRRERQQRRREGRWHVTTTGAVTSAGPP